MIVGPAAERRRGQTAAHHLAERHQVAGLDRLEAVPAGPGDPEAGQHLVHDQQRAVLAAQRRAARR